MRAFRGPFAAVSTPQFPRTFRFCHAFRDLLIQYLTPFHFFHDFRSSVPSIADGRGSSTDFGFFSVLRPQSANIRNEPRRLRLARLLFYFKTSLVLSRNFSKFPIHLCPTRVNFSTASSTTLPHPVEGAALLCGRLPPPFPLFGVSFSTGQSRSFRSASSTACARKKNQIWQHLARFRLYRDQSFSSKHVFFFFFSFSFFSGAGG